MAFVRSGLGVTISQELVMQAFGCPGVVSRPLEPACCRTLGLAFSKTASSVVSQTLLEYLSSTRQRKETPKIKQEQSAENGIKAALRFPSSNSLISLEMIA